MTVGTDVLSLRKQILALIAIFCSAVFLAGPTLAQEKSIVVASTSSTKDSRPVRFELTEHTRLAVDDYLKFSRKKLGEFLFTGPKLGYSMTPRQYGRLVSDWFTDVGLDPHLYGTHSLRRTKATHIYCRTGNLRAVQL